MAQGDGFLIDPDSRFLSLGPIIFKGWADGEAVTIENDSKDFNDSVGGGGEVVLVKSKDGRSTITARLQEASPTNKLLSALRKAQQAGIVGLPTLCKDGAGSIYAGAKAWLEGAPKRSMGTEAGVLEWRIRVSFLQRLDDGSGNPI